MAINVNISFKYFLDIDDLFIIINNIIMFDMLEDYLLLMNFINNIIMLED